MTIYLFTLGEVLDYFLAASSSFLQCPLVSSIYAKLNCLNVCPTYILNVQM